MPKNRRHYRVTVEDAFFAHDIALRFSGGRAGVRSLDDLQSALGRPYSGYHRTIAKKAAALMQSIATNHAFIDGNKRTSVILTLALIGLSGYSFKSSVNEIDDFVLSIVNDHLSLEEIEVWFKARIAKK